MNPSVFAVILNYKRPQDTLDCLRSVRASSYKPLRVVLVDNHSEDGCVEEARRQFPDVHILENEDNLGYAEGNNRAIRWALAEGADYVFILNNDTTIQPDTIQKLAEAGNKVSGAGLLAPKVLFMDHPDVLNSCGTDMDWLRLRPKLGACGEPNVSDWTGGVDGPIFPGSALFLKKSFLEKAGLFDAGFFLVHEDADLCLRGLKLGFKNRLVPEAVVYHGVSRALSQAPFLSEYYSTRNFLYLAMRHASLAQKTSVFLGAAALSLKKALQRPFCDTAGKQRVDGFFRGLQGFFAGAKGAYENRS